MKVIGLTGAPGCGKSTVLKIFVELGWKALDADAVCAELHTNPRSGIHEKLAEIWGKEVVAPDGTTNKKVLAEIVFADETERKRLEAVLHPFIDRRTRELFQSFGEEANVMFDVPLLFECGWDKRTDKTIAVWAPPEIQMERLLARSWTREHALFRIQSQIPAEKKLELADYGLINNSTIEHLKQQCIRLNQCLNS